ncbi:uncharacterized protein si:dkey-197j19.5 isoform X1 [Pseudorasbora parva]|uniref:uncharacterized protein si:dkey-197j19.5 isoform X1 n=1 Tax=Pseudorasbora parva TaxID=51549 RepID=UPI00351E0651
MTLRTECLLDDPTLEEEFRRLKKRDLTENYLFQIACGSFRPQKCSDGAFREHIMNKIKTSPATRPQPKHLGARPAATPTSDLRGAAEFYMRFPGDKPAEHPDWISDRKAFREALDGMGDLRRWLRNKPIHTDLEFLITERERRDKRMPSPPSNPFPPPTDTTSPRALRREVEEVKSFLRSRKACNLSQFLDWYGTGQLKRVDLFSLFKKDGLFIQPERMNALMSSLNSKDGNSVTVKDLAAGIQAWSGKHQEREEKESNTGYWNADREKGIGTRHHLPTHGFTLEETDDEKVKLQWEQELYTPFEYSETCPYFHTFPGDKCQTGINFADEVEAKQFYIAVQKQISDNKASHSGLTRRYSVGAVSDWKDKLNNCLRGHEVQKSFSLRSASRVQRHLDSDATFPEHKSSQINDSSQTLSTVDEESISLAKRKGPLPPLPLHARAAMLKLNRSASMQNFDSTVPVPSWVPPPPSYHAPTTPLSSAVKDHSSTGMKQPFHYNAGIEDESGYDDYL